MHRRHIPTYAIPWTAFISWTFHIYKRALANCLHINGSIGRFQKFLLHYTHTAEGVNRLIIFFSWTLANEFLFLNKNIAGAGELGILHTGYQWLEKLQLHSHDKGAEQQYT